MRKNFYAGFWREKTLIDFSCINQVCKEPIATEQECQEIEVSEKEGESEEVPEGDFAVAEDITQLSESETAEQQAEADLETAVEQEEQLMDSLLISRDTEIFENKQEMTDTTRQHHDMFESRESQREQAEIEQRSEAAVRDNGQIGSVEAGDYSSTREVGKVVSPEPTMIESKEVS
ncbi:unnamed protein product [Strongylus vulgaris]|uniref:Uncharacterized protein n=1 Tax=Strongylus vulgaris TaxID=40348 RepID=A0A3P7J4Y8_STRVU|nr:unnamed protein product [Strongylus vulgaris]